jgi:Domain of unknown function (DUF4062)
MAVPRVFVSSTCYDLAEERDGLADFCRSFGFDTTLSERGDVFYHPDLHTHLSCVRETSNCQLFILIIGGRFGGKYKFDPTKSITNAEYAAAVASNTPTFTFVKQEFLNDHNLWQRNKHLPFSKEIVYPSIDKQEHAEEIFNFIDSVRLADVNNGVFGFRVGRDIHEMLRKQWAGLMFEFLQNRSISKQLTLTNDALGNLSVVSGKIEALVKSIYRTVDKAGSTEAIETIDSESLGEEFLVLMAQLVSDQKFISEAKYAALEGKFPANWWQFLSGPGYCKIKTEALPDNNESITLMTLLDKPLQSIKGSLTKQDEVKNWTYQQRYDNFLALPGDIRQKLAQKYFWTKADTERTERMRATLRGQFKSDATIVTPKGDA